MTCFSPSHAWARVLLALALLVAGLGCSPTQNVRAYRAYYYENPDLSVELDRADDLAAAIDLADRLLSSTPYTPGDAWPAAIALDAGQAAALRAEIAAKPPYAGGKYEIPVVKLYRLHLERVLAGRAGASGTYPSVAAAIADLSPGASGAKEAWTSYAKALRAQLDTEAEIAKLHEKHGTGGVLDFRPDPPDIKEARARLEAIERELDAATTSLAKAVAAAKRARRGPGEQELLRDVVAVVSVASRVQLEALAIAPVVLAKFVVVAPQLEKAKGLAASGIDPDEARRLPARVTRAKTQLARQAKVLEAMLETLAAASGKDPLDTPGFALKESLVDQVVGIGKDSFRINLRGGAEAVWFRPSGTPSPSKKSSGSANEPVIDYTGRTHAMTYALKPIVLASAHLDAGFDYPKLPNFARVSLGYKTDRVYASGGSVEAGSLGQQLGVKGAASDALDAGLALIGITSEVRLSTFTAGTVRYENLVNGRTLEAPFAVKMVQIDVGYDISFLMPDSGWEQIFVGGRYFHYALPRVLYEFESTTGDDKRFVRESPPELLQSNYTMIGITGRPTGIRPFPWLAFIGELGAYAGSGPVSYYFLRDPAKADEPSNRDLAKKRIGVGDFSLGLGLRAMIAQPGTRTRIHAELFGRAELIYAPETTSKSSDGRERTVTFGGGDLLSSVRASFFGEF